MLSTSTLSFRGLAMALALVAGVAVVSDASAMSRKDKRTLVGAVVGGVAGNLLSNGDPAATVGGAVTIAVTTTATIAVTTVATTAAATTTAVMTVAGSASATTTTATTTTAVAIAAGKRHGGVTLPMAETGGSMTRPFALAARMALNAQPWM